jgi:hypothetical protein
VCSAHLHDGVVERDAPRRRLVYDALLQLLVPGEGVDRQRLGLGPEELDAVFDLLHLENTQQTRFSTQIESSREGKLTRAP